MALADAFRRVLGREPRSRVLLNTFRSDTGATFPQAPGSGPASGGYAGRCERRHARSTEIMTKGPRPLERPSARALTPLASLACEVLLLGLLDLHAPTERDRISAERFFFGGPEISLLVFWCAVASPLRSSAGAAHRAARDATGRPGRQNGRKLRTGTGWRPEGLLSSRSGAARPPRRTRASGLRMHAAGGAGPAIVPRAGRRTRPAGAPRSASACPGGSARALR